MNIHLFGERNPSGRAFRRELERNDEYLKLIIYSRSKEFENFCDLGDPESFSPKLNNEESIWVSFSPIWLFSSFFLKIVNNNPDKITKVKGLVVCSSSSVETKRFSTNKFDKKLFMKLNNAENSLVVICKKLKINLYILRPTMIYGNIEKFNDKNISFLKKIIKNSPLILLPQDTGLRQPIHIQQLAEVTKHFVLKIKKERENKILQKIIIFGGDEELTYYQMLCALKNTISNKGIFRNNFIVRIPNNLFYFLFSPILIISPKTFEALLRIGSNLAGFKSSYLITGCDKRKFPVKDKTQI